MTTPNLDQMAVDRLRDRTAALVELAGFGARAPIVVGVRQGKVPPTFLASGQTAVGEPLTASTVVFTASLSKQITAACAALLVCQGRLDIESALAHWVPEMPAWASTVRVRHLIHHTSGLPEGVEFDDLRRAGPDRTIAAVLGALAQADFLNSEPGTHYRYCNAGYVCLAAVVERVAGRPLADFAREHVFEPLGMSSSRYWSGPAPHPPAAAPLDADYPAGFSLGDAGVWSTAPDLLRWNAAMERDDLGVTALLQTPGHLNDGTELDYAWGIDVRVQAGCRIYRHGGAWAGLTAQLVRIPERSTSFVILLLEYDEDRTGALANAMIDELTT